MYFYSSLSETVLWSNPSPTAGFGAQVITLSDAISNYDYIKFTFYVSAWDVIRVGENIYSSSYVLNTTTGSDANPQFLCCVGYLSTSVTGARFSYHTSDKTLYISDGSNNSYIIPAAVIGIKYVSSGGTSDIYDALVAKGVTPTSDSVDDIVAAIQNMTLATNHSVKLSVLHESSRGVGSVDIDGKSVIGGLQSNGGWATKTATWYG